jgi:hypothetical protein
MEVMVQYLVLADQVVLEVALDLERLVADVARERFLLLKNEEKLKFYIQVPFQSVLPNGIVSNQECRGGIFYGHLEYLTAICCTSIMAIWYILWSFGIYFSILVCRTKKIWQP